MSKTTKTELSATNARLEELLAEKELQLAANEQALNRTQREFDAYRTRYSPISKSMITYWFQQAVDGTTEEVLLRSYMKVLLAVMKKYGEDDE